MLEAVWFCITTMTTVGYGDKVPFTVFGKIVASFAAILGTATISLYFYIIKSDLLLYLEWHFIKQ